MLNSGRIAICGPFFFRIDRAVDLGCGMHVVIAGLSEPRRSSANRPYLISKKLFHGIYGTGRNDGQDIT